MQTDRSHVWLGGSNWYKETPIIPHHGMVMKCRDCGLLAGIDSFEYLGFYKFMNFETNAQEAALWVKHGMKITPQTCIVRSTKNLQEIHPDSRNHTLYCPKVNRNRIHVNFSSSITSNSVSNVLTQVYPGYAIDRVSVFAKETDSQYLKRVTSEEQARLDWAKAEYVKTTNNLKILERLKPRNYFSDYLSIIKVLLTIDSIAGAFFDKRYDVANYVSRCILAGFCNSDDDIRNCANRYLAGKRKVTPPGTQRKKTQAKKRSAILSNIPTELIEAVNEALLQPSADQYRAGNIKALNSLVGFIMKRVKADPSIVKELLIEKLK